MSEYLVVRFSSSYSIPNFLQECLKGYFFFIYGNIKHQVDVKPTAIRTPYQMLQDVHIHTANLTMSDWFHHKIADLTNPYLFYFLN